MHHLTVDTYLFQGTVGVHEFHEAYPRTYIGFCGYSRIYVGLKNISMGQTQNEKSLMWVSSSGTGSGGAYTSNSALFPLP